MRDQARHTAASFNSIRMESISMILSAGADIVAAHAAEALWGNTCSPPNHCLP